MSFNKNIAAIIVAGGNGSRAGGATPKQWKKIAGKSVLEWTISKFQNHPQITKIILVIQNSKQFDSKKGFDESICVAEAGPTRTQSVLNGLRIVSKEITHVLVHDGVRPCVSKTLISNVIAKLKFFDSVIPTLVITDSLWKMNKAKEALSKPINRDSFITTQTPQGFNYKKILKAYVSNSESTTDCAALAVKSGLSIGTVNGDIKNIKITYKSDFEIAKLFLEN